MPLHPWLGAGWLLFSLLEPGTAALRSKQANDTITEYEACRQPLAESDHSSEDDPEPPVVTDPVPGARVQMPAINGMKYLLFVPQAWTPASTWRFPVVVFLHGSGDGKFSVMTSQSLPRLLSKDQSTSFDNRTCWCLPLRYGKVMAKRETREADAFIDEDVSLKTPLADCKFAAHFQGIAIMPQGWLPEDHHHGWDDRRLQTVQIMTQHVLRKYHGDPNRVILTGQSMGGDGAWRFASSRPRLWSAVSIICAPAGWKVPRLMEGVNIWIAGDESDGLRGNDEAVEELKKRILGSVRYTRYLDAPAPPDPKYRHMLGHASYDLLYRDPRHWLWAFQQLNYNGNTEWAI